MNIETRKLMMHNYAHHTSPPSLTTFNSFLSPTKPEHESSITRQQEYLFIRNLVRFFFFVKHRSLLNTNELRRIFVLSNQLLPVILTVEKRIFFIIVFMEVINHEIQLKLDQSFSFRVTQNLGENINCKLARSLLELRPF